MLESMIYEENPPSFDQLIDELTILNKKINTLNVFLRFKVDTFQLIQVGTFQLTQTSPLCEYVLED